jgi:outer membrane protein, adhesin transport system
MATPRRLLSTCLAAACLLLANPALHARCLDEGRLEGTGAAPDEDSAGGPTNPRATLQGLVRDALERSNAVGASRLLAEAAALDTDEARVAKLPQASVSAGIGPGGSVQLGQTSVSAVQLRATVSLSQLLYDGGRTDRLADWRAQLAESARLGTLTVREQLALSTVALALERSRFRQHVVIYGQYVRKMGCLVEALEAIVKADRGRASELVQARKTLQQAELLQTAAQSQARQIDTRLRRLVGDGLPRVQGLSTVLMTVDPLADLVADVERSSEIAQAAAQAAAANEYARALAQGNKPQVSWGFTGGGAAAAGGSRGPATSSSFQLGLQVTVPIYQPGYEPSSNAARRRAEAANLQRADALEARRYRVAEVHEQTLTSFERARRVGNVLRESDQLRNFTLQQWQQLGRRSLFDVMGAEAEHYSLRVAFINALHDGQQLNALLLSLGRGVNEWLR